MTDSDSSSSEDSSFDWLKFSPKKANESNSFFPDDITSFLNAVKRYVKEAKVNTLIIKSLGLKGAEVKSILEFLTHSYSKVTELNLEHNNFESGMNRAFEMLVKTKVKKLVVACSNLPQDDFMHLMEVLKDTKITNLDVGSSSVKLDMYETSKFTSHLLMSHITHLDIGANKFDPATGALTFVHALPHTSIVCLNATECHLHHDVLITLFSNIHRTKLTDLDVSVNEVTDEQIKELGPNLKASKLEKLNLSCNSISDVGIDTLAAGLVNSSVINLDISANNLRGKNILGSCLKNTKIEVLSLAGNNIEHCEMFSFPNFLEGSSVESLDISDCSLGDVMGQKLMRSLKFSNLTDLVAPENELGSLSISEFAKNVKDTKLTDIVFFSNALPFSDFVSFTECLKSSKLKRVHIAETFPSLGSEAVSTFLRQTAGTSIVTLDIGANKIAKVGAESVANILAEADLTINDLQLYRNDIEDGILKLAAHLKFSSLTRLNLSNNKINDAGAKALAKALKETQIVELDISENFITSEGASAMARGLKGSNVLYLYLSRNRIGNEGLEALAEHVKNTFITYINLRNNPGNRIYLVETVLWENRISEHHLVSFFKKIAPANNEVLFRFDHIIDNFNRGAFLEDLLHFSKTLEQPVAVTVLAEGEDISFSRSEIVNLMGEFPQQFSVFVASNIKGSVSQHINILRRAEELGLSQIVESLLLNRPIYMIDESRGILHPYVYKLLSKYKQPLYNLSVEPHGKMKIIDYFTAHSEHSDASDVISMLLRE